MSNPKTTQGMSAKALIIETLSFHGVYGAEAVAAHVIWSLGEEDFQIVKEAPVPTDCPIDAETPEPTP